MAATTARARRPESSEHAESYLKSVFAFIGISDVEFIVAEKIAFSPEHKARSDEETASPPPAS